MFLPASLAITTDALRKNELDLFTYVDEICKRIDEAEPQLHALLPETDRRMRLRADAQALQARFPDPATRPPLYGVPVGIKDVFFVDGFPTRAGSNLPAEVFVGAEAPCVTMLREAGAIILAKTVSTEFAYFEPGPTRNPHNLTHTPGGSSSGSAVAVVVGFCPLALGTQTIGSTIRPAAFCGVVGFKPSYGRIPTDGIIPCSPSVDTVGFFTQDVVSAAIVAPLLCGNWQPGEATRKPVLGVPEGPYLTQASEEALVAFTKQLAQLEHAGYTIRHVTIMNDIEEIIQRHMRMVFAEMAQVHTHWFAQYASLYRPRTVAAIREGQTVDAGELAAAREGRIKLRADLEVTMAQHAIDIWVCPSAPGPAPEGISSTGSPLMNLPWTHAGLPAISLPAGQASNGLPLGLQCIATFMADERLIAWAEPIAEVLQ